MLMMVLVLVMMMMIEAMVIHSVDDGIGVNDGNGVGDDDVDDRSYGDT
mgnify:CR=1 FL=1